MPGKPILLAVAQAAALFAQELPARFDLERDIPYAEPKNQRQMLDIYKPAGVRKNLPVAVWIHGRGWQAGDKTKVDTKPTCS
jgi:arylformamidase